MDAVATEPMRNAVPDPAGNTAQALDVGQWPVNVKSLRPRGARDSIFYGSIGPGDREVTRIVKEAAKARLVTTLWNHYRTNEPSEGRIDPGSQEGPALQLDASSGVPRKPRLSMGGVRGPSISFSHLAGRTWAAIGTGECFVGIDAARGEEFVPPYPFGKVFHEEEFEYALAVAGGNREEAAAFLWSCKEAVVKAMGCGFSFLDWLHLLVRPWAEVDASGACRADPLGPALEKFPLMGIRPVPVTAFRDESSWLSIAIVDPIQTVKTAP